MEAKTLQAELRSDFGKNETNRLRAAGYVPAVVYSHGETHTVKISDKALFDLFKGQISESIIFDLKIDGLNEDLMAYVKDFQKDPVTGKILHMDLFKVTKGEKIRTKVPLEYTGTAAGAKDGGLTEIYLHEIEIECFPKDLPEKIDVDISALGLDMNIHAKDVVLPETVRLAGTPEQVIVAVHSPRAAKEDSAAATESEAEAKADAKPAAK